MEKNKNEKKKVNPFSDLYDYIMKIENKSDDLKSLIDDIHFIAKRRAEEENVIERERKRIEKEKREEIKEKKRIETVTLEAFSMELPMDWTNIYDGDEKVENVSAQSISDGLILSLKNLGRVDIEYIAKITGESCKAVIKRLKGSIYQNPDKWDECFYRGWETKEEYLSGNLMIKLRKAEKASEIYKNYFDDNIRAIKEVMPEMINSDDIYVTLGTPWLPASVIDDFISDTFGRLRYSYSDKEIGVCHDTLTGMWYIPLKNRYNLSQKYKLSSVYGTKRINAMHIIEKTLNMQPIKITDTVNDPSTVSGKRQVFNKAETLLAMEKQEKLINRFKEWVWNDPKRKSMLEGIYKEKFASIRVRHFNGDFLEFPGLSEDVKLYPYQKNAVARILFSSNTLLAHDVGAGKTYIMIAAGMELKRMGISEKNMYVVPNNIVGQWQEIFKSMYPAAKLLIIDPKNFTSEKKDKTLSEMKYGRYDAILIAYSCFDRIGVSYKYMEELIKERINNINNMIDKHRNASKIVNYLNRKKKQLLKKLEQINKEEDEFAFDKLGINTLFVDEAHNYKNVPVDTAIDYVVGINRKGSEKCEKMLLKARCVQRLNGGRGLVFATGTPISNSITDAYIMQLYLQEGELQLADIKSFESWAGMFAEKTSEFEVDVDTTKFRIRLGFTKFHNLTELSNLLAMVADFHRVPEKGLPYFNGYDDIVIKKSKEFQTYLEEISMRADIVRNNHISKKADNMLKITVDGRKAALDLRLVNKDAVFTKQSKVAVCAENVYKIYRETMENKSTQLIFCDISVPGSKFNIYSELARLMKEYGIKIEEIAFIHSADNSKKRTELFSKVRKGEIRVLIGSTFKLGTGVNIQNRLIALHHMDVPWRPADMIQREGRILRQGNRNKSVKIFRYITEGSFDAYSWQLLEKKQNFISQLITGSLEERDATDIEDMALNYAEVKAIAIGNPLIKKRVEKVNELNRLIILNRKYIDNREIMEKRASEIPAVIECEENYARLCSEDIKLYAENYRKYKPVERKGIRKLIADTVYNYDMMPDEKEITVYQGFKIVAPAKMFKGSHYLWIKGSGRYMVTLSESAAGILTRIDNKLNSIEEQFERHRNNITDYKNNLQVINSQLLIKEDYIQKIESLKKEIKEIDKELGVDKNW